LKEIFMLRLASRAKVELPEKYPALQNDYCAVLCSTGVIRSTDISHLAGNVAELLILHSRFMPLMLCNPGSCPPPLPKLASSLTQALPSLLPLVDLDPDAKEVLRSLILP
jgi:hypothetical protein